MTWAIGLFRDPLRTFVILAVAAGGCLVAVVPFFGGIDEPAHFSRSYQISTGRFVPEKPAGSEFSGVCLPSPLLDEIRGYQQAYFRHLIALFPNALSPGDTSRPRQPPRCQSTGEEFYAFSTFGSPVPYVPQAATLAVSRRLGAGAGVMLVSGRAVLLAVYVAIVAFAISRAPRGRWAMGATALVPVAVFQSASSLSHDALTTAVSILVVSSALRALDPPAGASSRGLVVEAVAFSALLGLCKPTYVAVAFLYLLPLLASRERRARLWPLAAAPVVGIVVSVVTNEIVGDLWRTDADFFGIEPDPAARRHLLLTAPWQFVADSMRTVPEELWGWLKGIWGVGPSVTDWPGIVIVAALALYALVSVQCARDDCGGLRILERGVVLVVLIVTTALVFAANYVYWTTPGNDVITGIQARYLVPILVLIPLVLGPLPFRWLDSARARFPVALLLAPFLLFFVVSVALRMR